MSFKLWKRFFFSNPGGPEYVENFFLHKAELLVKKLALYVWYVDIRLDFQELAPSYWKVYFYKTIKDIFFLYYQEKQEKSWML